MQPGSHGSRSSGNSYQVEAFRRRLEDGIDSLPRSAGMYFILNRINGKQYVGQAANIYLRCLGHRSQLQRRIASNMLMRRDAEVSGIDPFFFALRLDGMEDPEWELLIDNVEIWCVVQLRAHDERWGYNLEAGHRRTTGALFRDRERKLMRNRSRKYELLDGVHMYDPIHPDLLGTWMRGS